MKEFHLTVVTPDGLIFEEPVESLLVRTDDGDVEFLAGHIDYMASLGTGKARIKAKGESRLASVSGGFVTVSGGAVQLVAVTFEFADRIDIERAKRAAEAAKETIAKSNDTKAVELARHKLLRALNRISVAES